MTPNPAVGLTAPDPPTPALRGARRALLAGLFLVVAAVIALIRFRCSPFYPPHNDVNSDVYVYQLVGNSWAHGLWPYRDVYDVKGPFLYLLFGLFAQLRPWSMGPPLVVLALLSFGSLCLAYGLARRHVLRRSQAALAAVLSCGVIYLSVTGVPTSFTCEELAVPGVLLLLWLMIRWLDDRDGVANAWWVLDGVVVGTLFWTKYQVVAPWAAMLVAVALSAVGSGLPAREAGRVVLLHLAGAALATAAILACFVPVLPELLRAYFLAKVGGLDLGHELLAEAGFAATVLLGNPAAALALLSVLVLLVGRVRRLGNSDGLVLAVAFCLSLWASAAFVRHSNNLFVPLSFCAVAVPQALSALRSAGRSAATVGPAIVTALAVAACVVPLAREGTTYRLFSQHRSLTCYQLPGLARSTHDAQVSTVFAEAADDQPILSVGTLFAARSSYLSRRPMEHRFQFVDQSWSAGIGADVVQARYLRDRTFRYVWIHIAGVDRFHDLAAQIAAATYTEGASQPEQAAALARNYVPVLSCNNELLLRAR